MTTLRLTLTPTDKVVGVEAHRPVTTSVPARVWEGTLEDGTAVHAFITRLVVPVEAGPAAIARVEAALGEAHPPPRNRDVAAYPARMVL